VIEDALSDTYNFIEKDSISYIRVSLSEKNIISEYIRSGKIDAVISLSNQKDIGIVQDVISLTRIYGIPFSYPKFMINSYNFIKREWFIGWLPVIEITSLSISFWQRVLKRLLDIILSVVAIILFSPLYILIGIGILIEDSSWPILFKNRRIWQNGKMFDLYKFRYMYWKYSIKDAYGVEKESDEALKYEESLKKKYDTREGPLYKIENDPRKMKFWRFIEKLSLDELPQLYNVLIGEMSLIGPRPHQPREVDLYDEEDKQVLIVKPGITGMAQVYGREKNSFKEEIALDRYYIEHYSILLDLLIFIRTFFVVLSRIWKKQKPLAKKKKPI
jgi:lipopolysaccharide/colanic/teichoic acid biosynthesis glycosyltransferase